MGRAKIAIEYIKNDKARNITFERGLKKMAHELATLCDVPVCLLIYQEASDSDSHPDVFSANCDVQSLLHRYASVPTNLQDVLDAANKKRKTADDHQQLNNNNNNNIGGCCYPDLDGCTKEDLLRVNSDLDDKMRAVKERIGNLIGGNAIGGDFLQIGTGFEHGVTSQPMIPAMYGGNIQIGGDNLYEQGSFFY